MQGSQSQPSSLIPSCGYGQSSSRETALIIEHKEKGDVYTVQSCVAPCPRRSLPHEKRQLLRLRQLLRGVNEPKKESCRSVRMRRGDSRRTERMLAWSASKSPPAEGGRRGGEKEGGRSRPDSINPQLC